MPDITLCLNHECEKRFSCYRYMAIPSEYMQSYSKFENQKNKECFWQVEDGDKIKKLDNRPGQ